MLKCFLYLLTLSGIISADNLHIDDFMLYLYKRKENIILQKENYFKKLSRPDQIYGLYFLTGAEEEINHILYEYKNYCINEHLKIKVER